MARKNVSVPKEEAALKEASSLIKEEPALVASTLVGKDKPEVQVEGFTPDQLKAEIEVTRAHMDDNLDLLGKKLSPKRLKALQTPLALAFVGAVGIFLYRRYRHGGLAVSQGWRRAKKTSYSVKRFRLGSLGSLSQLRIMLQLISTARRGKPAVFIVQPARR